MLYLLGEEGYMNFPWFQRSQKGLNNEARKRRVAIKILKSLEDIPGRDQTPVVMLLGASESWLRNVVHQAGGKNIRFISMINGDDRTMGYQMNYISMDLRASMHLAVDYMYSMGRKKLAFFGNNHFSTSDPVRVECFVDLTGRAEHVYPIKNSLHEAFENIYPHIDNYDGIICASDYAALSFVQHAKECGIDITESLYVIGQGNMFLSGISKPSISSVSDDYELFGRAALKLYSLIIKEPYLSSVSIKLGCKLHIRDTTGNRPYIPLSRNNSPRIECQSNPFYADTEVSNMAKLEWLLNQCDDTDIMILQLLMTQNSYSSIADACFISETATKYRVKKMEDLCGVDSRSALRSFLSQYII